MKFLPVLAAATALAVMTQTVSANVYVPGIFADHMVLQRNSEISVFGCAKNGETVTVTNSWNDEAPSVDVGRNGRWSVTIHTPDAGGPYTLTVKGWNTITYNDVLIGEVWLCSGQSNMEFTSAWVHNFAKDIRDGKMPATFDTDAAEKFIDEQMAKADQPQIRLLSVGQVEGRYPQNDFYGEWQVCTPQTAKGFSLMAYYFGLKLHEELGVPVGLINSSWGGTPADVWIPKMSMMTDPDLYRFAKTRDTNTWGPYKPGVLFNSMIYPLVPFRIAGVIWNQGEENVGQNRGDEVYDKLLAALVSGWREEWGYEFPFIYVQIPPYRYDSSNEKGFRGAQLRDMQRRALAEIPNSAMIVISDTAEPDNIHPVDKLTPSNRLAEWALNKVYHKSNVIPCGPLYKSMTVEGKSIRIAFDYAQGGLKSADGKDLTDFEIAGEDHVFHPARAVIDGDSVVVSSSDVKAPTAVRFAWTDTAMPNLAGGTDLPASTFRTDDWPLE